MRTWNQFLEAKQNEAGAEYQGPLQPLDIVPRKSARRSATINPDDAQAYAQGDRPMTPPPTLGSARRSATFELTPAQKAASIAAHRAAQQGS